MSNLSINSSSNNHRKSRFNRDTFNCFERDIIKNKVDVNDLDNIPEIVELIGGKINNIQNNFNEYYDILESLNDAIFKVCFFISKKSLSAYIEPFRSLTFTLSEIIK